MKKIVCLILSLVMILSLPGIASANTDSSHNPSDVKIGEYVVWSDTAFLFNIEYEGEKIPITVTNEDLKYFTNVFSDENLIYDAEKTASQNSSPTYEDMPCFYVEDNRNENITYNFYFNDSTVVLKKSSEKDVYSFSYKNKNTYSEMQKVIDKCAELEIEMQGKYLESQSVSNKDNSYFIYNPVKIFDSQFTVTTPSGVDVNWYWGFFGYSAEENKSLISIASYISKTELWNKNVTYGLFADKSAEDNVIDFSNTGYTRLSDKTKLEIKQSNILGYSDIKMSFNVSENKEIEAIKMELTATNGVKETYNVDMKTFFSSGSIPASDAFKFSREANSVVPKEIEDSTPKFGFFKQWSESQKTIKSVQYKSVNIGSDELNALPVRNELATLLDTLQFTYVNKQPTKTDKLVFVRYKDTSLYLTLYDGYAEFEHGGNSEYYTYSNTGVKEKLEELFKDLVHEEETNFMNYHYLNELDLRWKYEFEITLNEEQQKTWIGEVCENGKVKITAFHNRQTPGRYYLTFSGNGKTFTTYLGSTDDIVIEKDTPLPFGFEKGGEIKLSWASGSDYIKNYKNGDNLTVSIYAKIDNAKKLSNSNVDYSSPVGGEIPITKLGEVIDLRDEKTDFIKSEKPQQVFVDVPKSHWAHEQIEKFYYAGIVRGIGAGLCAPDDTITYEQFGMLLERLFGYEYENNVKTPALRQDVIAAVVKACNIEASNSIDALTSFDDADIVSPENAPFVSSAITQGIAEGYDKKLRANESLTRAEAITLLYRAIKIVYDVDDNDIPEKYKFKITPYKKEYISVSANKPTEFRISDKNYDKLSDMWFVNVDKEERMEGQILLSFGPDGVKDTHIYIMCKIDEAIYTLESKNIKTIEIASSPYFYIDIFAEYNVYKDGALIIEGETYSILYEGDIDEIRLQKKSNVITTLITFEGTSFTDGKLPKMPDKQPLIVEREEMFKELEEFEGGKQIFASIYEGKGKGIKDDMFSPPSGSFSLNMNKDKTKLKLNMNITAPNEAGTMSKITVEATETIEIGESHAKIKINVYCDGNLSAENAPATITGLNNNLDELITISTDDSIWSFSSHIYEIGN